MLASAVGPNLTKLLHDQLDLMLACGLSEPLVQALVAIAKYIPPLLKTIQGNFHGSFTRSIFWPKLLERLLDVLSQILSSQPYRPLGAPPSLGRKEITAINKDLNPTQVCRNLQFSSTQTHIYQIDQRQRQKSGINYPRFNDLGIFWFQWWVIPS